MKWTMDALLPADKRYTSLKFRRVAPRLDATRLDYAEAAELAAFVESIGGVVPARWIFHWDQLSVPKARALMKHMQQFPDHHERVAENLVTPTRAEGLAVLRAMQDGGWRQGGTPPCVRLALLDMRDEGISQPKIAKMLGLTHDQVRVMANGPRKPRRTVSLADMALVAS